MSSFLLIDIGNSRLKWASVDSKRNPVERDKKLWNHSGAIDTKLLGSKEHRDELAHYILNTIPTPSAIGLCSVATESAVQQLNELLQPWQHCPQFRLLGDSSYPSLRTQYQNTHTLGADRWAALIAARELSNDNTLVISAGTATTIDFLGGNGMHYGGWILPGLGLMREGLLQHTAGLNVASLNQAATGIGLDTASAIDEGSRLAHLGAIAQAMDFAKQRHQAVIRVWIVGGHAATLFDGLIHNQIPAEKMPSLVLRGLWAWLNTQVKTN
ncbi:type III pantothenate kinase [Polynucleobacter sp. HIN5]|uniref:type III pantothenate kinase n=1 Tax=Polynucleobacter sp. HIN5 TaxID=3047864 RepID=UPI0025724F34|nr:type III pantothenate kinase [Polynucleobacter sp. HIN5]BEI34397.1 type III pantothenate kinase [Polynucleobacter sp. HIN5]